MRRYHWYLYGGVVAGIVAARTLPPEVLLVAAVVIAAGCIVSLRFYP